MKATEENIKLSAEILNILAKNKCTVTNACQILSFVEGTIKNRATVPEQDYLADFTERFLES